MEDLAEAIQIERHIVNVIPSDHPRRSTYLNNLGELLGEKYGTTGMRNDLDEAIQIIQQGIDANHGHHTLQVALLCNLTSRLGNRYSLTGAMTDLEEAIKTGREAVKACRMDQPERRVCLNNLGIRLSHRYGRTGQIDDLEESIQFGREVIKDIPQGHPNLAEWLNNLAVRIGFRYTRYGAVEDLGESIQLGRKAIENTSANDRRQAAYLNHLANRLGDEYLRTNNAEYLREAIEHAEQAVKITTEDHPNRAAWLNDLGVLLGERFSSTGTIDDLEQAIEIGRRAGGATRAVGATLPSHPDYAGRLNTLGGLLSDRYLRTQSLSDLEESIELGQEAVDTTPSQHPNRVRRLDNLADSFGRRHSRTGHMNDLEKAIQIEREVIKVTPDNHPDQPAYLNNLGIRLSHKFSKTNQTSDLEEAIRIGRMAIEYTAQDNPSQAGWRNNLCIWLRDSFLQTEVMTELDEAICHARKAVEAKPKSHLDRAGRLTNLGVLLGTRYCRTTSEENLEESITCFHQALTQVSSPVLSRIRAGILCVHYLAVKPDWHQAYEIAGVSMKLVPLLSPQSLENSDKQYVLSQIAGFASDAAAVAMEAGKGPLRALDFLEQGRGVLATSIEMRADVEDLRQKHPALATDFAHLQDELENRTTTKSDNEAKSSPITAPDNCYQANREINRLLITIRQKPGFERFLLPPSEVEMRNAAECGPIIVINTSKYRSDALLIEQEQVRTVALALGITEPPADDNWPHVWWIPTGLLTRFPLHAAGRHGGSSFETVLDRVMSSYGSSVKAIIHARQRPLVISSSSSALVVAMDSTPECSPLPFASKELKMLLGIYKSMAISALEVGRRVNDVMSQMLQCEIFHFAGHGQTDNHDPSKSNLILEDGKLMVANLLEQNLRKSSPFLAYLSACGTGRVHNERFFDESIHLISAFQLAGFRHVIGTLWEVNDRLCVDMARITYEEIRDSGMTDKSVCLGLHKAARELRQRLSNAQTNTASKGSSYSNGRDIVSYDDDDEEICLPHWVPYVHFGI
ncbi:Putative 30S ribosomal protein S17P-like protein [Fusarium odoratissimum]|uniref:Putative 30S ribosomal protein S17P-like protein n=1 Tax=Fusarium oxysporum f. sp. cubense (strain race 4) TaxID=2502994 RepID=N1RN99_FUSC4|nr:Putative 30S ribosomal protein S17P-like protein [Fusarium odoratissimum]